MIRVLVGVVVCGAITLSNSAASAAVILSNSDENSLQANAEFPGDYLDLNVEAPRDLSSMEGATTASATNVVFGETTPGVFEFSFDVAITFEIGATADVTAFLEYFQVSVPSTVDLIGSFSGDPFVTSNLNFYAPDINEFYVLEAHSGVTDAINYSVSYQGILQPGIDYYLNFSNFVAGLSLGPASGSGSFSLIITELAAPVPEPSSLMLFGMGAIGGVVALRKRRKA